MKVLVTSACLALLRVTVGAAILIHDFLAFVLARPLAWTARLKPLVRLSDWVATLPPWGVLAVLALPVAATEPFKILGLWWIAVGQGGAGLLALAFGHGVSLILVERIFTAGLPSLRRYRWIAALHDRFLAFRTRLLNWVAKLPAMQALRPRLAEIRARLRDWRLRLKALFPHPSGS